MRLLLDTHALVWWLNNDPTSSKRAREAIAHPDNEPWVSAVSGYELLNKQRLGKLDPPIGDDLPALIRRARLPVLSITLGHAVAAGNLPGPHRDPWDRLLMAQAQIEGLTIITCDQIFAAYGIPTLW